MLGLSVAPNAAAQQISSAELEKFARQWAVIYIALDDA
jgi:hypothetical protein